MKVLFISPQLPYPYIGGAKMVTYNTIKYLSKNNIEIILLCIGEKKESLNVHRLDKYCTVKFIPLKISNNFFKIIKNLFSSKPYFITKYNTPLILEQIDHILSCGDVDIVHIERLHVAYCAKFIKSKYTVPVVFRPHNVESSILLGYLNYTSFYLRKKYLRVQQDRLYKYEKYILKYFDKCLAISKPDRDAFKKMNKIIDCVAIAPGITVDLLSRNRNNSFDILFVGSLDWRPNEDSLFWFVYNVLPILNMKNKIKLTIVGQNPSRKLNRLNKLINIEVKGFVDNLDEYYSKANVAIVPLQYGGGVKIKIIESLLMKVPLVTTNIGAKGIDCINGKHLLTAKNAGDFAKALEYILNNRKEADKMAENGYMFAKKEYDPIRIAEEYSDIYFKLIRS